MSIIRGAGGVAQFVGAIGKPPQYTTFRYFRVFITTTESTTAASIAELQFRTAVGVPATTPPATGVAIGGDFDSGIVGYAKAFTGSNADFWLKTGSLGSLTWVGWDFGAGNEFSCRQVLIEAANGSQALNAPKDFSIDGSNNGSSWTTLLTPATQASWAALEDRTFNLP
jgi:hypothetical protein